MRQKNTRNPNPYIWVVSLQKTNKSGCIEGYFRALENELCRLGIAIHFSFEYSEKVYTYETLSFFNHLRGIKYMYIGLTIVLDSEDYSFEQYTRLVNIAEEGHTKTALSNSVPSFKVWTLLQRYEDNGIGYDLFLENSGLLNRAHSDNEYSYINGSYKRAKLYAHQMNMALADGKKYFTTVGSAIESMLSTLSKIYQVKAKWIESKI